MSLITQEIRKFLGLVGALSGGLIAVLYVLGFLIAKGLYRFLGIHHHEVGVEKYLLMGAEFLLLLPNLLLHFLLVTMPGWIFASGFRLSALAVLPGLLLLARLWPAFRSAVHRLLRRVRDERKTAGIAYSLLLASGAMLLFHASLRPLRIRDALFSVPDGRTLGGSSCAADFSRDLSYLSTLLAGSLALAVMLYRKRPARTNQAEGDSGSSAKAGRILSALAVFLTALSLLLLPVDFGVLATRKEFPIVQPIRTMEVPDGPAACGPCFLIGTFQGKSLLYSADRRRLFHLREEDWEWSQVGFRSILPAENCPDGGAAG